MSQPKRLSQPKNERIIPSKQKKGMNQIWRSRGQPKLEKLDEPTKMIEPTENNCLILTLKDFQPIVIILGYTNRIHYHFSQKFWRNV
jgi:hypothetical protein